MHHRSMQCLFLLVAERMHLKYAALPVQRLARIQQNAAKLRQLDVQQSVHDVHAQNASKIIRRPQTGKRKQPSSDAEPSRRQPARTSARLQGATAQPASGLAADNNNTQPSSSGEMQSPCRLVPEWDLIPTTFVA